MTYPLADLLKMKLRNNPASTLPLISKHEVVHPTDITRDVYDHPWHQQVRKLEGNTLNKPNPPSKEAVERARFVDKTYHWKGGGDNIRSRDKRTTQ